MHTKTSGRTPDYRRIIAADSRLDAVREQGISYIAAQCPPPQPRARGWRARYRAAHMRRALDVALEALIEQELRARSH